MTACADPRHICRAGWQVLHRTNPAAASCIALANTLLSLYYGLELQLALEPELDVEGYLAAVKGMLGMSG